jgi:hypothetical protein
MCAGFVYRVSGWLAYGTAISIIFEVLRYPDRRKNLEAGFYGRLRLSREKLVPRPKYCPIYIWRNLHAWFYVCTVTEGEFPSCGTWKVRRNEWWGRGLMYVGATYFTLGEL